MRPVARLVGFNGLVFGFAVVVGSIAGSAAKAQSMLDAPRVERPLIEALRAIQGVSSVVVAPAADGRPSYTVTMRVPEAPTPSGALILVGTLLDGALHEAPAVERAAIGGMIVNLDDRAGQRAIRMLAPGADLARERVGMGTGDRLGFFRAATVNPGQTGPAGRELLTAFCTPQRRAWTTCRAGT